MMIQGWYFLDLTWYRFLGLLSIGLILNYHFFQTIKCLQSTSYLQFHLGIIFRILNWMNVRHRQENNFTSAMDFLFI